MAIGVTFRMVDSYSRTSNKGFEGTDTVLADAITSAEALQADLAAVSLCGMDYRTLRVQTVLSEAIETGANVDAGGTLHVRLNNGKQAAIKIPAIDPDLVNPDGSIDIEASAITDFVANFETAGKYRISEGNYVTAILYGELDR